MLEQYSAGRARAFGVRELDGWWSLHQSLGRTVFLHRRQGWHSYRREFIATEGVFTELLKNLLSLAVAVSIFGDLESQLVAMRARIWRRTDVRNRLAR